MTKRGNHQLFICLSFNATSSRYDENQTKKTETIASAEPRDVSKSEDEKGDDWRLLYRRSSKRSLFPRSLLAFSTIHSAYWAWYVLDFTPAINAAANNTANATKPAVVLVDPTIGFVGLGLAIFMSLAAMTYPCFLIYEVRLASGSDNSTSMSALRIKTYKLPFVSVPKGDGKLYRRGSVVIDSTDLSTILSEHQGDIRKYRGHLGLRTEGRRANLLLQIKDGYEDEVKREDVLLNSLLSTGSSGVVPVKRYRTIMEKRSAREEAGYGGRKKNRSSKELQRMRKMQRDIKRR